MVAEFVLFSLIWQKFVFRSNFFLKRNVFIAYISVKIVENLCPRIFNVFVIEYECCASCVVGKRLGHHLFSLVLFPPPILAMGHSTITRTKFYPILTPNPFEYKKWTFCILSTLCLVTHCGLSIDPLSTSFCPRSNWLPPIFLFLPNFLTVFAQKLF